MSRDSKTSLEAGLEAVKSEDWETAKTILETVAMDDNPQRAVQAQIGLVVVYAKTGDIAGAMTLSEILAQSNNPEIQEWANRSLEELLKRNRTDINARIEDSGTGFVPFEDFNDSKPNINETIISPNNIPNHDNHEYNSSIVPVKINKLPTIHWRRSGRAKTWQEKKLDLIPLRLLTAGSFVALFWVVQIIIVFITSTINNTLVWLPFLEPIQFLYQDPTTFLVLLFLLLTPTSPWLLDKLLSSLYGIQPLETTVLEMHSQEALRILKRFNTQRRGNIKIKLLPIAAPIAFTYGHFPSMSRIVMSQGLLQQLTDDEIAAMLALQLGHVAHWDASVMSLVLLVTIPIYKLYQLVSTWGDRVNITFVSYIYIAISSLIYGIWCLCTGCVIALSQVRLYYADLFATNFTGNPNGITRALLKISNGIANDIQKQEQINWRLESLNISLPVGFKQSITLGSLAPHVTFESLLMWDYLNPYRYWLTVNNTHPLIGDRIQRLLAIAGKWRLDRELDIDNTNAIKVRKQIFSLQIAPFLGIPTGLAFALLIGVVWQTLYALKILNLKWIYDDWGFAAGCIAIGLSIGTLIRINAYFPELKSTSSLQTNEHLPALLTNPAAIGIDSHGVKLHGKILGRRGVSNSLGQDLILQTNTALIKMHHVSFGQPVNPQDFIGRQVTVTGWLRRDATPWLDIQSVRTQTGKIINSTHPIWATVVAVAFQAWGAYILLKG
ncbi:Zn-dependent protease with chaperone function [Calothrix sp. HK-06]|nr:Zn-dependent protease with chaperone function [Calothrix sp. HK-06]